MDYTETNRTSTTTITTDIEFVYNGQTYTLSIPHFEPGSEADIEEGIQNRIITEIRRIDEEAGE